MTDDKLDVTFRQALALSESTDPSTTAFASTPEWDSIGHLQLLAALEEAYGISLATEDVAEMTDYPTVRRILSEKYGVNA